MQQSRVVKVHKLSWWVKRVNETDLYFFDVTPMVLGIISNDFLKAFFLNPLNAITKSNNYWGSWPFISWEDFASKPNHTVATLENILEIVRSYSVLGTWGILQKGVLKNSQNSHENTFVVVFFLINSLALGLHFYQKRDSETGVFLWSLQKRSITPLLKNLPWWLLL